MFTTARGQADVGYFRSLQGILSPTRRFTFSFKQRFIGHRNKSNITSVCVARHVYLSKLQNTLRYDEVRMLKTDVSNILF